MLLWRLGDRSSDVIAAEVEKVVDLIVG